MKSNQSIKGGISILYNVSERLLYEIYAPIKFLADISYTVHEKKSNRGQINSKIMERKFIVFIHIEIMEKITIFTYNINRLSFTYERQTLILTLEYLAKKNVK